MKLPNGDFDIPRETVFYVVDSMGDEAIIGLPSLLGNYFSYFWNILQSARGSIDTDNTTKDIRAKEAEKLRAQDQDLNTATTLDDVESALQVKQAKADRATRRMYEEKQKTEAAAKASSTALAIQHLAPLNQIALGTVEAPSQPSASLEVPAGLTPEQLAVPDDDTQALLQLSTNRAFPVGNVSSKPTSEAQACFSKAFSPDGKCTTVGCKYAHDEDTIRKFVAARYRQAVESKFFTKPQGATLRQLVGAEEDLGSDSDSSDMA
jgi:hypothetical protein